MATTMAAPTKHRRRINRPAGRYSRVPKRWIVRLVGAAVVGIAGATTITHSLAYILRSTNSDIAHRLAPYDGRVTALTAALRVKSNAIEQDRLQADVLARLALRQDPTAQIAVSTLGLNAQIRNRPEGARRFFGYAEKLSRRDVQTQLWAIEDAVGRGNVAEALSHYDTVLRTTPSLAEMLFPVLSAASADPQIREPLIKTLLAQPAWKNSFLSYITADAHDPLSTVEILTELDRTGNQVPNSARSSMVNTLINAGAANEAWKYYATFHRGADRRSSRDPHFAQMIDTPSQFDWNVIDATGINASIQRNDANGIFDFSAPAMIGGRLLQQLQSLPPGSYSLSGRSQGLDQAEKARPYWLLSCQDGREISRVALSNSKEADGSFQGTINIPQNCPVQTLSFILQPSEDAGGVSGQIDFLQIKPTR